MSEEKYGLIPDMDWLKLTDLIVDPSYQRDTLSVRSQKSIEKIVKSFSWSKFSPITVAAIANDKYAIIDGQHRVAAARQLKDIDEVPCWIVPDVSAKAQADSFVGINRDRVSITPYALHKSLVASGDATAIEIEMYCRRADIVISKNSIVGSDPRETVALQTIKSLLLSKRESDLSFGLNVIRSAFPNKSGQLIADVIKCLADMHGFYGIGLDKGTVIVVLQQFIDMDSFKSRATQLAALDKSLRRQDVYKRLIINEYNTRSPKGNKLRV